jgi:hypothetical protein
MHEKVLGAHVPFDERVTSGAIGFFRRSVFLHVVEGFGDEGLRIGRNRKVPKLLCSWCNLKVDAKLGSGVKAG